jgi:cytochrome bd-type quinol oxidase subunit 2
LRNHHAGAVFARHRDVARVGVSWRRLRIRAVSRNKVPWDIAFIGGSLIAALCQGIQVDLNLPLHCAAGTHRRARAAAPASQMFLLIGTLVLLPVVLSYFVLVHWLFWGKLREGEGYH